MLNLKEKTIENKVENTDSSKSNKHIKKNKFTFKKFLLIYVIILCIFMIMFLIYVADSLKTYENNQVDNYMNNLISDLKKASKNNKINIYINMDEQPSNEFEIESAKIDDRFKEIFNNEKITYKINNTFKDNNDNILVYDIYAGENIILTTTLDGSRKENRLSLLNFTNWETKEIQPNMENILYTANIIAPNNYKVYINDNLITEKYIAEKVQEEGLAQISKYVEIPYLVKYEIKNFYKEPNIKIYDENEKEVEYIKEGNVVKKDLEFKTISNKEEALKNIKGNLDVQKIAEDWSLYLTDDLKGNLHGFYNINKYLIKDSDIYKNAYKWATGIDITYVSSHVLSNPTFTNERIENFKIYNENAFSCEVYLQKNLKLTNANKRIEDIMHERMYFAYYQTQDNIGEWKLVNMQSITDNQKK